MSHCGKKYTVIECIWNEKAGKIVVSGGECGIEYDKSYEAMSIFMAI
jgi:hypothetical protein